MEKLKKVKAVDISTTNPSSVAVASSRAQNDAAIIAPVTCISISRHEIPGPPPCGVRVPYDGHQPERAESEGVREDTAPAQQDL